MIVATAAAAPLEPAKDPVTAVVVGCSAAASAVAASAVAAAAATPPVADAIAPAAVAASTDTVVWQRTIQHQSGEFYWSGESALYHFTRTSTNATLLVLAKRYHRAEYRTRERAVFDHLAANLSADDLRAFVRTRLLPSDSRPDANELVTMQKQYVRQLNERKGRQAKYLFSADPQQPAPPHLAGSSFLQRLAQLQPSTLTEQAAAISRRVEWFHCYDYTADRAIHHNGTIEEGEPPAPKPAPFISHSEHSNLRSSLFWRQDADGAGHLSNWQQMEEQCEQLALHLFRCLQAHHRAGVLLGDIKPGNMFFNEDCLPVFGDYGHATVFDKTRRKALHPGIITPNPRAADSLRYRPCNTAPLPPAMRTVVSQYSSTQDAASRQPQPQLRLVGTCEARIGTTGYRALETLVKWPVDNRSQPQATSSRVYTERSDAYSLAVSLVELFVGYTAQFRRQCPDPSGQQVPAGRAATGLAQSTWLETRRRHLLIQCDQLEKFSRQENTCTKPQWLKQGALARVPLPLIQLLRQLIEPPLLIVRQR
jgi:hypothetical protein